MASPQPAKTKDEQLARVRRNQQRCRDRKRAHVASLETQVETLRTRLQSCQPCDVQSHTPESEIETLRRENAARKDLLAALGFDEDSQKKFIDHEVYRQAVRSVFQGQVVGNDVLATTEQYDLTDFGLDDAWLPTGVHDPISGLADLDLGLAGQTKKSDVEQCFLDTAISIQPMETSTPCSTALSWILQNNVKGYTLAAIQDRLRDGVICAAGPAQECRVKNNVLFQVLAEVSSGG